MSWRRVAMVGLVGAAWLSGCREQTPSAPTPIAAVTRQTPPAPPGPTGSPVTAAVAVAPRVWTQGRQEVPVLMYHDVLDTPNLWFDLSRADFRQQLQHLREAGVTVVRLDQVVAHLREGAPLPPRAVALTFDQGTRGLYTTAWPLLREFGYPATFFVHTGYVGRPSPTKEHVTWDQLRELAASGQVSVQPMSVTFPEFLGQLPPAALRREVEDSFAAVERELGERPRYFASPYGNGDERVAAALVEAGCEAAFNEVRAPCAAPADRLFLPRYNPKRLAEALQRLSAVPSAPSLAGPLALQPAGAPPTGPVRWQSGVWPRQADRPDRLRLGETALPCRHLLLAAGRLQPLADADELAWQGRPLVVGNQHQVVITPYRRWMSARGHVHSGSDALDQVVRPASFAVLGERWIRRGGQWLARPSLDGAALVGIDSRGALWWGRVRGAPAAAAASLEGWPEVVVLAR
ncbi:MAG: polysaccharide deacetylase family protein [Fimbriimonadaceae bacterium]|nr:polysaccharide deacetylase family protein [Fimbriimonadaceae bacterium]